MIRKILGIGVNYVELVRRIRMTSTEKQPGAICPRFNADQIATKIDDHRKLGRPEEVLEHHVNANAFAREREASSPAKRPSGAAGWASSQRAGELVGRNIRLTQDARERADLHLAVHRHHTTVGATPHDDVAARLTNLCETEMLKGFDDCRPGGARQLRHALAG